MSKNEDKSIEEQAAEAILKTRREVDSKNKAKLLLYGSCCIGCGLPVALFVIVSAAQGLMG